MILKYIVRSSQEDTFTTESCRVSPHLVDLDQSHPYVEQRLLEWLHWIVSEFGFDALRFDAVKHVSKSFWQKLKVGTPDSAWFGRR